MGYQLKQQESLAQGVRRIAREQMSQAMIELQNPERNRHQAIHEVRKQFKKLRGLIRLVRSGLGDEYAQMNLWCRDAGRRLSRVRDAESMLESLAKLRERFSDSTHAEMFSEFESRLLARKQRIVDEWIDLDADLKKLSGQLEEGHRKIENWKIKGPAGKVISHGLHKTYQRGTKALKDLHRCPSDELFHECRKRSKYHLYHIRLLGDLWQPILAARLAELDQLNDYFGNDHDLAVMTQLIHSEPETLGASAGIEQLLNIIGQQRQELQTAGLKLADRVFAEESQAFARRMKAYWSLWRDQSSP